jgi:hypothetical protein
MFQVFHLNVTKVDLNVAYVCKGDTRTLKYMFQMFICFRRMLQVFHMDVAKIDLDATYVSDGACDPRGFIARERKRA